MSDAALASVLVMTLTALLAGAIAALVYAQGGISLAAIGIARDQGRDKLALLFLFVPVAGWIYLVRRGSSVRWTFKYLWASVGCMLAAALLFFFLIHEGHVAL